MDKLVEKIDAFIAENEQNYIRDIQTLVRIKSIADPNTDVKPFGQGCRDVLDTALEMGKNMGFDTENYEYYCGSVSIGDKNKKDIAIWSHLDVVPEGDESDWAFPPYSGEFKDGYIFGRGCSDNKAAAVMALYILKFLKENNIPLNYQIKLMLGCSEETTMADTKYYLEHYKPNDLALIADTDFPVCYAEKGIYEANIEWNAEGTNLISFDGGLAANVVPDKAIVKLKNLNGITSLPDTEWVTPSIDGDIITLNCKGTSAHAAWPEGAQNAISSAASYLLANNLLDDKLIPIFTFIENAAGTCHGEAYGIAFEDEITGILTCNSGMLHLKDGVLTLNMNIRYPVSDTGEAITSGITNAVSASGGKLVWFNDNKGFAFDKNHPAVSMLTDIYNELTGENKEPYTMGGGTYARKLPNAISFGPGLGWPKLPMAPGHGGAHQPDEHYSIASFKMSLKIYILSILRLNEIEI